MHRLFLAIVGASFLAACDLHAQSTAARADSASATFQRGEWGVGFTLGPTLAEAGALRFMTSSIALVLDASGNVQRVNSSSSGVFPPNGPSHSGLVMASLGPRWYHALSSRVVRFAGIGVSGWYGRGENSGGGQTNEDWSTGAYGELGVEYMFTRNIGFGWRGNLNWSRTRYHASQPDPLTGSSTTNAYLLTVQPVQVTGTIFF